MKKVNYNEYEIVSHMPTLRAMERKGLIKFASQTGTKITGLYSRNKFTCHYIDEAPIHFEYNGNSYGQKYFSGCFYPYVVKYQTLD